MKDKTIENVLWLRAMPLLAGQPPEPEKHEKTGDARGYTIDSFETVESDFAANITKEETQEADEAAEHEKISKEDLQINMKRAAEEREIANKEVQEILADQSATQKILTALLNTLEDFSEKAALVQPVLDSISLQGVQETKTPAA